jgi:hypothetical protein
MNQKVECHPQKFFHEANETTILFNRCANMNLHTPFLALIILFLKSKYLQHFCYLSIGSSAYVTNVGTGDGGCINLDSLPLQEFYDFVQSVDLNNLQVEFK